MSDSQSDGSLHVYYVCSRAIFVLENLTRIPLRQNQVSNLNQTAKIGTKFAIIREKTNENCETNFCEVWRVKFPGDKSFLCSSFHRKDYSNFTFRTQNDKKKGTFTKTSLLKFVQDMAGVLQIQAHFSRTLLGVVFGFSLWNYQLRARVFFLKNKFFCSELRLQVNFESGLKEMEKPHQQMHEMSSQVCFSRSFSRKWLTFRISENKKKSVFLHLKFRFETHEKCFSLVFADNGRPLQKNIRFRRCN